MGSLVDFLALDLSEADAYLSGCRQKLNRSLGPKEQLDNTNSVVMLAVMDGAVEHHRNHANCHWHYLDFTSHCRRIMQRNNGEILPPDLDGWVDYLACGWFPRHGIDSLAAASAIHQYFRKANDLYRPPWMHEKHAVIGVGCGEYEAFQLVQMAGRDQTVIDPDIWEHLSDEVRTLVTTLDFAMPNFEKQEEEIDRTIGESVRLIRRYCEGPGGRRAALPTAACATTLR